MNLKKKHLFSQLSVLKKGTVAMLCMIMVGAFPACNKSDSSDITGVWVCKPEPDITITLTVDSKQVYVSTSPHSSDPRFEYYQFYNGDQYVVREDTLRYLDNSISYGAFAITKRSSNSMELKYLGALPDMPLYVRYYLFNRKTN